MEFVVLFIAIGWLCTAGTGKSTVMSKAEADRRRLAKDIEQEEKQTARDLMARQKAFEQQRAWAPGTRQPQPYRTSTRMRAR